MRPLKILIATFLGIASTCSAQQPTWTQKFPAQNPPPRHGGAMVFDAARNQVVLFGGLGDSGFLGDTWVWDGSNWTQKSPATSPPARIGQAMAYDAARSEVVLFGGNNASAPYFNDTWTWDGTNWTHRFPTSSPPARASTPNNAAYDIAHQQVVIFGGIMSGGATFGDTWVWDGSNWTQKSPATNPSARGNHTITYDATRQQVVLFGGSPAPGVVVGDTWVWDGTNWSQQSPSASPPARYSSNMAYDAPRQQLLLFGGQVSGGAEVSDTWVWNGTKWTEEFPSTSPPANATYAMASDPAHGQVVFFGGSSATANFGDTWVWGAAPLPPLTWTQKCPATSPPARYAHDMAYDASRGQVVLFGGSSTNTVFSDTWVWDGINWTQKFPATTPPARAAHAMAYDAARGQVVLFGGFVNGGPSADTWVWDGTNWTQKFPATSPPASVFVGMTYDAVRQQVVLFGGGLFPNILADTWVWDGVNWTQKFPASSPAARTDHRLAYDAARGNVMLFGSWNGNTFFNDTWVWDGTSWTQKFPATNPPTPRFHYGVAYDAAQQQVVLFGGQGPNNTPLYNDTWAWGGTTWTQQVPATNPPGTTLPAMAYDEARSQIVLFGGFNGSFANDSWVWGAPSPTTCPPPTVTSTLTVASTNPSSGVAITVSPSDNSRHGNGTTQFTRTYNNGVVVSLGAPAAGGNNFSSWTGCDSTSAATCTVMMNANRTATANYVTSLPAPPPSITSVSPTFGIQGQTVAKLTVTGNNFQPTSTISFSGTGITVNSYSSRISTQIVANITLASNAAPGARDVIVTNPDSQQATLAGAFRALAKEFQVFGGHSGEPTVAADLHDPLHAVVAFNDLTSGTKCGWAESRDGGATWNSGSLTFPLGFHAFSDPWVRYSPNGDLFYSCIGTTDKKTLGKFPSQVSTVSRGIFVAVSLATGTGLAKDLGIAQQVIKFDLKCAAFFTIPCDPDQGELPDHPSIGFLGKAGGPVRPVVCWIDDFQPHEGEHFLQVAFSDNGITWSKPKTLAASANVCNVGGGNSEVGVTWWNSTDNTLKLNSSIDGANWSQAVTLASLGPLFGGISTTSLVLNEPYALLVPGNAGLRAMWQSGGAQEQVFIGDATANSIGVPFRDPDNERLLPGAGKFLPGAGSCARIAGAYEVTTAAGQFRYKVWPIDGSGPIKPIFTSGVDLDGRNGDIDPTRFSGFRRIGDYTGVDCSGSVGWAVWTDLRNGKPEIWGAVIPLP